MSFSGFSEDDIRKLSSTQEQGKPMKKSNLKSNKNRPNFLKQKKALNNNTDVELTKNDTNVPAEKPHECNNDQKTVEQKHTENISEDKTTITSNSEPICDKKLSIDEFEARQKLIEEQNRKRKELLAKALADRTKQTREEAARLEKIQEEFKKLDAILSNDVKILRKQIEVASIEYTDCEKRYHKIEKEFLEAKVLLHQKLEKKEMLTEHLCTIIEKNEERKAKKLIELLQQLQVGTANNDTQNVGDDH